MQEPRQLVERVGPHQLSNGRGLRGPEQQVELGAALVAVGEKLCCRLLRGRGRQLQAFSLRPAHAVVDIEAAVA